MNLFLLCVIVICTTATNIQPSSTEIQKLKVYRIDITITGQHCQVNPDGTGIRKTISESYNSGMRLSFDGNTPVPVYGMIEKDSGIEQCNNCRTYHIKVPVITLGINPSSTNKNSVRSSIIMSELIEEIEFSLKPWSSTSFENFDDKTEQLSFKLERNKSPELSDFIKDKIDYIGFKFFKDNMGNIQFSWIPEKDLATGLEGQPEHEKQIILENLLGDPLYKIPKPQTQRTSLIFNKYTYYTIVALGFLTIVALFLKKQLVKRKK